MSEKGGYSFDIEVDGGITIAAVFCSGLTSSISQKRFVMLMPKIALYISGEPEWFTSPPFDIGVDH